MDKFETQFEDLDVATGYYENATSSATAVPVAEGEGVLKKKTVSADFAPVQENDGVGVRGLEVVIVSSMRDVVWGCG